MASSLNLDRVSGYFNPQYMVDLFRTHRAASISALGAAVLVPFAIRDYSTFISYGPGGVPHNAVGWLMASLARAFALEQFSTKPYNDKKLPLSTEPAFLPSDFPPKRSTERPRIGPHPMPQRQLEQLPSEDMRQALIRRFKELGDKAEAKGLVEIKQSFFERRHSGIFVSPSRQWHAVAQDTRGEITHVHAGLDGSIHVTLHPEDCKKVFEAGWGQRHAFSGSKPLKAIGVPLPVTYVLIYAPRDQAELDIAMAIVEASIQFMTGTREPLE